MYCNKIYQHKFNEKLEKRFVNTYRCSNHDTNKFNFLLRKGIYPLEYIDDWEKFNEKLSPENEYFHSHLNMDDFTDADYVHANTV